MRQWIAEAFDNRSIDLGTFAQHFEADFLGRLGRELSDQSRHPLEHGTHLLRTHRHDAVFQLARVVNDLV